MAENTSTYICLVRFKNYGFGKEEIVEEEQFSLRTVVSAFQLFSTEYIAETLTLSLNNVCKTGMWTVLSFIQNREAGSSMKETIISTTSLGAFMKIFLSSEIENIKHEERRQHVYGAS